MQLNHLKQMKNQMSKDKMSYETLTDKIDKIDNMILSHSNPSSIENLMFYINQREILINLLLSSVDQIDQLTFNTVKEKLADKTNQVIDHLEMNKKTITTEIKKNHENLDAIRGYNHSSVK